MTEPTDLEQRVAELERTVAALETALHLSFVGVAPALTWLDKKLERES